MIFITTRVVIVGPQKYALYSNLAIVCLLNSRKLYHLPLFEGTPPTLGGEFKVLDNIYIIAKKEGVSLPTSLFCIAICFSFFLLVQVALDALLGSLLKLLALYLYARNLTISSEVLV